MKSILLSIKPKYVALIASGKKTIEVRKTAPKEVPFKCYIYMTQGAYKDLGLYSEGIYQNRMKVIGEFICDKVYLIKNQRNRFVVANEEQGVTNEIARQSCLDYDDMVNYLGNKDGYGWRISELKIYDKPRKLSEFYRPCSYSGICYSCNRFRPNGTPNDKPNDFCDGEMTRPPQSWQFVEELGNE